MYQHQLHPDAVGNLLELLTVNWRRKASNKNDAKQYRSHFKSLNGLFARQVTRKTVSEKVNSRLQN
jgi:hypothetical protein